ncbi:MAG: Fic family protein [Holosporaceae bacterium]|jgi:Fic family protein|nr:Fic family protein [Holosporaceae bacterium]
MLYSCNSKISFNAAVVDKKKTLMLAYKMLPEYVFDTSQLENNPITFPEVKTLLDGVTIGGHKINDVQQVLNIKNAWFLLFDLVGNNKFTPSKNIFHQINKEIAQNEALYAGIFRNGSVNIAGTKNYTAPSYEKLDDIFETEIHDILDEYNTVEQAIRIFLWGSLNQFYWDGNKRTARLIANGILINEGAGVFNIKTKDILEFNTLMIDFYDTKKADSIVEFLSKKCIFYMGEKS